MSNFQHVSNAKDVYEINHLDQCLCPINSPNIELFGSWDEGYVAYLKNNLYKCENTTEKQDCLPKEDIEDYFSVLNRKYFNYISEKQVFLVDNYENPVQSIFNADFLQIDLNFFKTVNSLLKHAEIHDDDDDDILLSNDRQTDFLLYGEKIRDFQLNSGTPLIDYSIYVDNEYTKFTRTYPKIQDVFAKVGVISKILFIFGAIILYFDHKKLLQNIVLTQIYESPEEDEDKKTEKTEKIMEKIKYLKNLY